MMPCNSVRIPACVVRPAWRTYLVNRDVRLCHGCNVIERQFAINLLCLDKKVRPGLDAGFRLIEYRCQELAVGDVVVLEEVAEPPLAFQSL